VITRVLSFFGHDLSRENETLRTDLAAEKRASASVTVLLNNCTSELAELLAAAEVLRQRYIHDIDGMTYQLLAERKTVQMLSARNEELNQMLLDAAAACEEANARSAMADQRNRDLLAQLKARVDGEDLDEQLALMHPLSDAATSDAVTRPADLPASEESKPKLVSDVTAEGVFRVLGVFFLDRRYWLLSRDDGKSRVSAAMQDRAFLDRLHGRLVSFTDGDSLRVKLNTRTWQRADGSLTTQYAITEVLEVIAPPEQLTFDQAAPAAAGVSS